MCTVKRLAALLVDAPLPLVHVPLCVVCADLRRSSPIAGELVLFAHLVLVAKACANLSHNEWDKK